MGVCKQLWGGQGDNAECHGAEVRRGALTAVLFAVATMMTRVVRSGVRRRGVQAGRVIAVIAMSQLMVSVVAASHISHCQLGIGRGMLILLRGVGRADTARIGESHQLGHQQAGEQPGQQTFAAVCLHNGNAKQKSDKWKIWVWRWVISW